MNRITVYQPYFAFNNKLYSRTIEEGQDLPKGCYYHAFEALQEYERREQLKLDLYKKHQPEADKVLDKLERELKDLLKASNCSLYFVYGNDSYGMYGKGLEIATVIDGYEYTRVIELD